MDTNPPKQIVLVGGGHTHWIVLEILSRYYPEGLEVTLVSDVKRPFYSGLIPGVIGGAYEEREAQIDLPLLCSRAGARFIKARAVELNPQERTVLLHDGRKCSYDILSLNVGVGTPCGATAENPLLGKTKPSQSLMRWRKNLHRAIETKLEPSVAILGAGAAGVELALQLSSRYPNLKIHLIYRSKRILPNFTPVAARQAFKLLRERRVSVYPNTIAKPVSNGVMLDKDSFLGSDYVLDATTASPQSWLAESGVVTTENGFLLVAETLQSLSHSEIFASGDSATIKGFPTPRAGVFAVKQGSYLAHNIVALAHGKKLKKYIPQKKFLSILGADRQSALAIYGSYAVYAPWLWRLKEWIDFRFMARFS